MTVHVVATPGHSHGSLSFHLAEDDAVFTGDAIPVPGDIPIYVSASDSLDSLERLRGLEAGLYLPAWDDVYTRGTVGDSINRSAAGLGALHAAVVEAAGREPAPDADTLCRDACRAIGRPGLADIPLFRRSVQAWRSGRGTAESADRCRTFPRNGRAETGCRIDNIPDREHNSGLVRRIIHSP